MASAVKEPLYLEARFRVRHGLPALSSRDETKDLEFCVCPYYWYEIDDTLTYLGVRRAVAGLVAPSAHHEAGQTPNFAIPAISAAVDPADVRLSIPIPREKTSGLFGFHVFSKEINHDGAVGYMSLGHAVVDIFKTIVLAASGGEKVSCHTARVLDLDGKAYGCLEIVAEASEALVSAVDEHFTEYVPKEKSATQRAVVDDFVKLQDTAIKKVFGYYKASYSENTKNIFTFFVSPSFPLPHPAPILAFVALSRKFVDVLQSEDGASYPLLRHSAELLSYWAKISNVLYLQNRAKKEPQNVRDANVLSEFLTLPFRGMVYSLDTSERKEGRTRLTDQWIQLLNFPSLGKAFYDCEDGSLLVLQVYSMLLCITKDKALHSVVKKNHPELAKVVSTAMLYQPFFAICELGSPKSEYTAHATVLLLPHSAFKKAYRDQVAEAPFVSKKADKSVVSLEVDLRVRFGASEVPSVIAESTTYIDGAMVPVPSPSDMAKEEDKFFDDYETFRKPYWVVSRDIQSEIGIEMTDSERTALSEFANVRRLRSTTSEDEFNAKNGLAWVRRVRDRASIPMVVTRKVFRNVFCLMSPFADRYTTARSQHRAKFEYYLIFNAAPGSSGEHAYGAPMDKFLTEGTLDRSGRSNGIRLVRCGHISEADIGHEEGKLNLHEVLRDFPVGSFPTAPGEEEQAKTLEALKRLQNEDNDILYYTRTPEEDSERALLKLMMTKFHKEIAFHHVDIPLAAGLSTTAFYKSHSPSESKAAAEPSSSP